MNPNYLTLAKLFTSTVAGVAILSAPLSLQAAVSQQPLSLTEGVSPNLLVTLDDSGSMAWAYAPDDINTSTNRGRRAWRSNAFNSMYYDPNTTYRVPKQVKMVSGEVVVTDYATPSFTNAPQNGYVTNSTKVNLSTRYQAQGSGTSWLTTCGSGIFPNNVCSNSGYAPAHYFQYNVSASCPEKNPSNANSCYTYTKVEAEDQTNFAIWYAFYRTRNLATRSAANLAFYTLPENVRITWGSLNTCNIGAGSTSSSGTCSNNTIKRFSEQHRVNFFNWLDNLPQSGGTPLHSAMSRAGNFLKNNNKAYKDDDGSEYACRASYHILMTDGIWNGRSGSGSNNDGHLDYPYKDDVSYTLADLAYEYWAEDLRSGMANKVPTYMPFDTSKNDPRNNPADWQHMVNFTVGLGLSNALQLSSAPTWGGSTFANHSELMDMASNGKRWPTVGNDNNNNVYDLWHAAINSRGEFFSADSPDSLVNAFSNILSRIAERTTSAASPAINSGMQEDASDALVSWAYQTSYSSDESWAGDLKAYKKERLVNNATGESYIDVDQAWSARAKLATRSWGSRNIMIASTSGATKLQKLDWSNAGALNPAAGEDKTLAYYLRQNPDDGDTLEPIANTLAVERLKFIRGERDEEDKKFRKRHSVLGDMISSKPATVRGARYLTSYASRIEGIDSGYGNFYLEHKERSPRIYVGANDGMLHGFNAVTGEETFAFIPTAVFPKLHKLTGKNYTGAHHQFYVDGSPVIADVYINNQWRTVLIGTLRAGGKGLFALDVTEPDDIKLLWEFGEEQLPAGDHEVQLGYSFPQPTVARLHNGQWAVVTGNGYEASSRDNGKAALLLIDIASGDLIKSIEVEGVDGIANGLSTPKLVDMNTDGLADYAYAGDLQGNLWRFNLSPDNNPDIEPFKRGENGDSFDNFKVSYGGNPLFKAVAKSGSNTRQPITAAPSILRHPSGYGNLVVLGTGKYFEEGDKSGIAGVQQSIYGVWDTAASNPKTNSLNPSNLTRSRMQAQKMESSTESVTSNRAARTLSQNSVQWATPPSSPTGTWPSDPEAKYGWYFDLVLDREMMIENMNQLGQTILFQTLLPSSDPCSSGVENWTYAINPYTGGRTQNQVFLDFTSSENPDTVITAIQQDGEGGLTIGQTPDGQYEACTGLECIRVTPDPSSIGRQSWRKVEDI